MQDLFQIYDLDFNPIPLPRDELGYGLRGLGLEVSSIGQEVTEHSIAGVAGSTITGVRDTDRDMSISAWIEAMNKTDYLLKRDRVYSFFKEIGSFYVTETRQANKLMKVRVIDKYLPEKPGGIETLTLLDIPLKIDGKPYWISRGKTMELHEAKGIPANGKWSFGMGLDVTPENLIYQYENQPEFTIYNAGILLKTVQEKGNCEIKIDVNEDITSFMLYDDTGRYWEYNPSRDSDWAIQAGNEIVFNGHDVRLNGTTILERTNRYYPIINSGTNQFRVSGLSDYRITFDFRFKYN